MSKQRPFHKTTDRNTVRIESSDNLLHLKFATDLDAIQSAINPQQPQQLIMQNLQYLMGILLFTPTPQKILLLGVGGGSLVHYFSHYLPQSDITGVEYDAELIDIAQQQLGLPGPSDRLHYQCLDARDFITASKQKFDLIVVDIFEDGRTAQWLLEKTFNRQLKNRLTTRGAVAYNLLIDSEKRFSRFYQLMRQLYQQQTLCLETENYENILVYGLNHQSGPADMEILLGKCATLSEQLDIPFSEILSTIYSINPQGSGII